jgi:hypothetical protein
MLLNVVKLLVVMLRVIMLSVVHTVSQLARKFVIANYFLPSLIFASKAVAYMCRALYMPPPKG